MTSPGSAAAPAFPPHRVRFPVNIHHWDAISFLHWPFDPKVIDRVLPEGLSAHIWDGAAWVGATPFRIRVRPPGLPPPPGWTFPETNLRTYVVGPDGRTGICFLRMEVTAAWFAATLRTIGLPYVRQEMAVAVGPDRIAYLSRPPTHRDGGGHEVVVRPGARLRTPGGGIFERFLTARWRAFHRRAGMLMCTPVEHPPWLLHAATAERCEVDGLFGAAGLPAPRGAPVVHWSPGVTVRVGWPRIVR